MAKKKKTLPKIVGFLQEYLRSQLGDKKIVLKELETPEVYTLVAGEGAVILFDEESGYRVSIIPILRKERDYWFSFILSMKGTTSEIDSVGIAVYAGNKSDLEKVKLFRAEWSQNSHHKHAQPHWHLHREDNSNNKNNQFWDEEQEPVIFSKELVERASRKLKKIHFAMAAQWHENKESHVVSLRGVQDNEVLQWICNTFEYIVHQLNYLEDKSM